MSWFRKEKPKVTPWLVTAADWVYEGADPTDPRAPKLETLKGYSYFAYDEESGLWTLTADGVYESERQRAGGEPPWVFY